MAHDRFARSPTSTTMTDARDRQSDDTTRGAGGPRRSSQRGQGAADPTDPEVPDAKRRRALGRRRSVVVAAAAVGGLVVIALLLLYRMGRQVTNAEALHHRDDTSVPVAASSVGGAAGPTLTPLASAPLPSASPEAIATGSNERPLPRTKPPAAPDIFRKPAF